MGCHREIWRVEARRMYEARHDLLRPVAGAPHSSIQVSIKARRPGTVAAYRIALRPLGASSALVPETRTSSPQAGVQLEPVPPTSHDLFAHRYIMDDQRRSNG